MASKRNVKYVAQEEPAFLKKFKARVGYKEPADINAKFSEGIDNSEIQSNENEREIEDEEPVVVVLKQGDMTAEQVAEFKKNSTSDCWDSENDKPIFKKPEKRASSEKDVKKDAKKKKSEVKPVKNSKLLSFDEDDEG